MASRGGTMLKGCGAGCGVIVVVLLLAVLLVSLRTCSPLRSASRAQGALEEQFGSVESFVPAADGAISPAKVEAFLRVRGALTGVCEELERMEKQMGRMERLDENLTSGREIATTTRGFGEVSFRISPWIGDFFAQRNQALLDAGLGMGEYMYLFSLVYQEQLATDALRQRLFSSGGQPLSAEVRAELRAMLERQLASLDQADSDQAGLAEALAREIAAMAGDPDHLPWSDGVPVPVEVSLASYRERLDAAICAGTAGIELDRSARRALAIALY